MLWLACPTWTQALEWAAAGLQMLKHAAIIELYGPWAAGSPSLRDYNYYHGDCARAACTVNDETFRLGACNGTFPLT